MRKNLNQRCLLLAACGLAVGVSGVAYAQPKVVNISGATLLESFVSARASTNDYIDVDGNGVAGIFNSFPPQNLTPVPGVNQVSPFPATQVWATTYRVSGSVRGVTELASFGNTFVTNAATGSQLLFSNASRSWYNGAFLYQNGATIGTQPVTFNSQNPGGMPIRADVVTLDATYTLPGTASPGGVRIDIAPCDVPGLWVPRLSGSVSPTRLPGTAGYGAFSRPSTTAAGTGAGIDSRLPDLGAVQFANPLSPPPPSATNFLFDNPFAFAPIAFTVNYGVGRSQATQSEMRHLFATGRMPNGENLIAVTRDIGSGTRNAVYNSVGLDPSFGGGDNVSNGTGPSNNAADNLLGANFVPNNKGGNNRVEEAMVNARLSIGYVGPERGGSTPGTPGWLLGTNPQFDVLAIRNDLQGGTDFSRPNIDEIVDNDANGYTIGGPAVLVTLGSPLAESVADGGTGALLPKMPNPAAAKYMNNIRRSIADFITTPGGSQNDFMPGELAAVQFVLTAALDTVHNQANPLVRDVNAAFNLNVQNFTRIANVLAEPQFYAFNTTATGRVPTRTTGTTYSDGVVNGVNYINQNGVNVSYNGNLTLRNKIAGDFSGNGVRDINDTTDMLRAFRQRNGGPAWTAPNGTGAIAGASGGDAIIEVLGDFNCDGNFNAADVRYFADGLALSGGSLDRAAAFTRVDSDWNTLTGGNNFFGTTLATASAGAVYTTGAARADVRGAAGIARGWAPVGANGVINAADIDYVYQQFKSNANISGDADWNNVNEAAFFDLSADMTGDLKVNQADVDYVVLTALQTSYGDANLDRKVDLLDLNIWASNFNLAGGWAQGDISGNATVDAADYDLIMNNRSCASDLNNDGFIDNTDFVDFANAYNEFLCADLPALCLADINNDRSVDNTDFVVFANAYNEFLCP